MLLSADVAVIVVVVVETLLFICLLLESLSLFYGSHAVYLSQYHSAMASLLWASQDSTKTIHSGSVTTILLSRFFLHFPPSLLPSPLLVIFTGNLPDVPIRSFDVDVEGCCRCCMTFMFSVRRSQCNPQYMYLFVNSWFPKF